MTQLIEVEIGGESLYVQPQSYGEPIEILGARDEPSVTRTGAKQGLEKAYAKAKSAILALAADLDRDVRRIPAGEGPSHIDVEFSLGFSTAANAWVVGTSSNSTLKIKFTWAR